MPRRALAIDALLIIGCALIAGLLEQDANWDQLQHHYWYPWQLFNGGFSDPDLYGGRFQNPIAQVPFFAIVTVAPPVAAQALLGALNGTVLVIVRRIAALVLPPGSAVLTLSTVAALLAAAGAGFRSELGTSYSDVLIAGLLLGGLWAMLRDQPVLSGLVTGLALGAKYTAAPFVVAAAFALLILTQGQWRVRLLWSGAVVGGWLLLGAWWAWDLATTYGSPVFPFWNQVFGSPWFPDTNLTDDRYGVTSIADAVVLPWRMAIGTAAVLDLPVRDPRWLIALVLVTVAVVVGIGAGRRIPRPAAALCIYVTVGLALWLLVFGVLRYAIPAEMLIGIVMLLALGVLLNNDHRAIAIAASVLLVASAVTTQSAQARRVPFGDNWFMVDATAFGQVGPDDAILVDGQYPSTFLLPSVLPDNVAVHVVQKDYSGTAMLRWLRDDLVSAPNVWVLTGPGRPTQTEPLGTIDRRSCQPVDTNIVPRRLCRMELT